MSNRVDFLQPVFLHCPDVLDGKFIIEATVYLCRYTYKFAMFLHEMHIVSVAKQSKLKQTIKAIRMF